MSDGAVGATPGADERAIASLIAEGVAMAACIVPAGQTDEPPTQPARAQARPGERTDRLPVLLYHRVAEEGPAELARYRQTPAAFAEQMGWLRRNGYHAVTSTELLRRHRPRRRTRRLGCRLRLAGAADGLAAAAGAVRRRHPFRQPHGKPQPHGRPVEP